MTRVYAANTVISKEERTAGRIIKKFIELDPDNMIEAEDLIIEVLMLDNFRIDKSILIYSIDELFDEMEKKFESNLSLACMRTILRLMKRDYFSHQELRTLAVRYWFPRYTLETYTNLTEEQIMTILDEIDRHKEIEANRQEQFEIDQAKKVRK